MTKRTLRWASTWSGSPPASSSVTKIAMFFQYGVCERNSTIRPKARSLSAIYEARYGYPLAGPRAVP